MPYTIERLAQVESIISTTKSDSRFQTHKDMKTQPDHPSLLIPGPIEVDDAVLCSMSHFSSESHVGAPFVKIFGEALFMLRRLFQTSDMNSQPFIISGSGTLGWDLVAANLAEPGDDVLVLSTGYFAQSFSDCFETYGIKTTLLNAPIGSRPQPSEIEVALRETKYKLLTVTHVDTSTGVLSELRTLSELVHRVSPQTLLIVDGVCSVGSEEIDFDAWKLDGVITASQKGIGGPAGLSISIFSERAILSYKNRRSSPGSYYASFLNWMPIMQSYEAQRPSYFATPSPHLIRAVHTSLTQILSRPLAERFAAHQNVSQKVKKAIADLGLNQLARDQENQANGMTAFYLPENINPVELLSNLLEKGVILAGGLHKEISSKYVRFGHMGVSVIEPERGDIDRAIQALKTSLSELGYHKE
ncbi:Alanine--glyoxylate aminotransferase 1 [Erysiphe neolycopersici]|uniref:alanine--glyoxylate transaminase n=1 Tax=Erysiphe neolycopersici TaxID=212602 RepID=A0A420HJM9_9PEZI|nr:Alanine--glyoxylate aminotransferase 1 [Erysiphe neolycopersici]